MTGPPLAGGALVVSGDTVVDLGPSREIARRHPDVPERDLGGVVVVPGLVDAHAHLEWSLTGGLLPSGAFGPWLRRMLALRLHVRPGDPPAAADLGAMRALEAGTTTLADAGPAGAGAAALRAAGMRGTAHLEVFGTADGRQAAEAAAALEERLAALDADAGGADVRVGLSPHAPYSVGPALWRALAGRAGLRARPWATHLAESDAEEDAIARGAGPLADALHAHELAPARWPGEDDGSVARLAAGSALRPGMVAAHAVQLRPGDPELLAGAGVAVAHCPTSNAHLGCGRAPIEELAAAGVTVGLGTDSPASGGDYDLRSEARACARAAVSAGVAPPTPAELVRLATLGGAEALGRAGELGHLTPGARADLVAIRPAAGTPVDDPHLVVLDPRARVETVLVGGEARIEDGVHRRLDPERVLARAAEARRSLC